MDELNEIAAEMRAAREYADLDRPASETNAFTRGSFALKRLLEHLSRELSPADQRKVFGILQDYEDILG